MLPACPSGSTFETSREGWGWSVCVFVWVRVREKGEASQINAKCGLKCLRRAHLLSGTDHMSYPGISLCSREFPMALVFCRAHRAAFRPDMRWCDGKEGPTPTKSFKDVSSIPAIKKGRPDTLAVFEGTHVRVLVTRVEEDIHAWVRKHATVMARHKCEKSFSPS
mmetsp:Transcript_40775/g.88183  ORF Transcript_40775/g.88183 Transcript_40775/m.88183 type:complete len:165 (+) Transcript_40775:1588-2082(+)